MKFTLKELSVEELDRYRWKVAKAVESLRKAHTKLENKTSSEVQCEDYFEVATAIAQAERRINKLENHISGISDACKLVNTWLAEVKSGNPNAISGQSIDKGVGGYRKAFLLAVKDFTELEKDYAAYKPQIIHDRHNSCKNWCCAKAGSSSRASHSNLDMAGKLLAKLAGDTYDGISFD